MKYIFTKDDWYCILPVPEGFSGEIELELDIEEYKQILRAFALMSQVQEMLEQKMEDTAVLDGN